MHSGSVCVYCMAFTCLCFAQDSCQFIQIICMSRNFRNISLFTARQRSFGKVMFSVISVSVQGRGDGPVYASVLCSPYCRQAEKKRKEKMSVIYTRLNKCIEPGDENKNEQECIPVGCVLSAAVAVSPREGLPQCMLGYQPPRADPPKDQASPQGRHPRTRHPPGSRLLQDQAHPPGTRHPL